MGNSKKSKASKTKRVTPPSGTPSDTVSTPSPHAVRFWGSDAIHFVLLQHESNGNVFVQPESSKLLTAGCWADPSELEVIDSVTVPEEFVALARQLNFNNTEDPEEEEPNLTKQPRAPELVARITEIEAHPLFNLFYTEHWDNELESEGIFFGDCEDDLLLWNEFLKSEACQDDKGQDDDGQGGDDQDGDGQAGDEAAGDTEDDGPGGDDQDGDGQDGNCQAAGDTEDDGQGGDDQDGDGQDGNNQNGKRENEDGDGQNGDGQNGDEAAGDTEDDGQGGDGQNGDEAAGDTEDDGQGGDDQDSDGQDGNSQTPSLFPSVW
jgi:hypothetical protein